ncbi:amidohydrolase family protein [Acidiphilium iwatense]|uniref:Amidohydrolase family protein n=1 Tax=Acidiphilium iwatense TaxID=768198 RepID=A0ABS9E180_9PROT|nr:amidohydrolase family protein [Acidiphilium iwatense]MCF3948757.1 amidohydrolase family protein [Acidiphilium iwatense]
MPSIPPLVDMRLRPSFLHTFFGSNPGTPDFETVRWLNKRVGGRDVDHFTRSRDLPSLLAEMTAAGIGTGLMVGRSTPTVRIGNDMLAEISGRSGGRLLGVASVDPVQLGAADAVAETHRAITELGLSGLNIDAGFYAKPLKANDGRLLPLYEVCEKLGVPACVMSGPTTPDLAYNDPLAVDDVARLFPKLSIICCHGFYPRIADMIAIAFRNENVIVSPDMYTWAPGGRLYLEAVNGFMQDQFLFGSSYPFRPMKQGVSDLMAAGLSPEVLAKVGYGTAERLFNLHPAASSAKPPRSKSRGKA